MRQTTLSLTLAAGLAVTASLAAADQEDCPDLGLDSVWLSQFFCDQFGQIIADGTSRSIDPDDPDGPALPEGPGTSWASMEMLQDSWRMDPRKTLELIDRIRTAGGLPES
jgi:hypothetical protein